jgi:Kef-type K+ transport system membrane component KefB
MSDQDLGGSENITAESNSESKKASSSSILASRTNQVLGLVGALLGVFVLVVQVAGTKLVMFILAGAIVLTILGIVVFPWRPKHNLRIGAGLAMVCIGAVAITFVALQKSAGAIASEDKRKSGEPHLIFTFPLKSHSGGPISVHRCMGFAGTVRDAGTGVKVLMATKGASGPYFFKLADQQPDSEGLWFGEKTIGQVNQPGLYDVYAMLVNASTAERLSKEQSGPDLPAEVIAQVELKVNRQNREEPACGEKYVPLGAPPR